MSTVGGYATALGRRLLGNGPLRRVLLAYLLFSAAEYGTWVAILLYAYERTGPLSVGLVALVQLVPAALAAPAASALGDRFPRERVLAAGYAVQAVAMFLTGLTMLADAPTLVTYALAAVAAASLVVTRPTQSALLPSLAMAPADCTIANGASGFFEGGGQLIGPLAAAAILAVGTPASVFFAASVALVVALIAVVGVRPRTAPIVFASSTDDEVGLLAGLRLVLADRDARVLVGLLTARMLVIGACDVLFVLLALELLDTGEPGAGILAAALGAGAMLGGAGTFTIVGRPRLAAVAAAGAVVWGTAIATVGLVPSAVAAPLLVVVGSAGLAIVDICGRTMLQRSVRDEVLARVFGLQEGLGMAGLAAGSVLVPILVAAFGLVGAVVAVGAILPLFVALRWPRLADLERGAGVPAREIALLRAGPIFRPLPAPELEAVARRAVWLDVPAGEGLIREGDPGDRFYVLAAGSLRVERGGAHLRDVGQPGEGVGEIAILRDVPRTASVFTNEPSTLLAIDRAPFLAAVTGHPEAYAAADALVATRDR
ncbi:MAG TPA: cyclic nucleotide-binding domain-containing protein [Candidatus Limnocylindrales bacterium]|nr:cyclic nucleotide-binding domain-containing protein [Candidatus Limnocylindrales bacterium]